MRTRDFAKPWLFTVAALVALKATGALQLPWEIVLLPIWLPALIFFSLLFLLLVLGSMFGMMGR